MRLLLIVLATLAGPGTVAATPAAPTSSAPAPAPAAMRPLSEPATTDEPAWPRVQRWIAAAPDVQVLPADAAAADAALLQAQVTPGSALGAVLRHTGGLLVDHGWLRILGSGSARMKRSLPAWNDGKVPIDPSSGRPLFVLVADDVLGGQFAINGGALGPDVGQLYYFAPDTLRWEPLSLGYADFLAWALSARVDKFYESQRWPRWEDEVARLDGDRALSVYPPLWAQGDPIARRSRRAVALEELVRRMKDVRSQLGP